MATAATSAAAAAAIAAAAEKDAKLNCLVAAQLQKTKMCAMHRRGTCKDPTCQFAHSSDELRCAPDLTKTAICRMFARGQCRNPECKFAHGEQELRVTPNVYKTQLCNFFTRGHCKKGNRCRHAHGDEELRGFEESQTCSTEDSQFIEEPQFAAKVEVPSRVGSPVLRSPAPVGLLPGWWSSGGNSTPVATPPPSNMMFQPTPEKVVPVLPGAICMPQSARLMDMSITSEPMKVALPTGLSTSSRRPSLTEQQSDVSELTDANLAKLASQLAWAQQAEMDYELAAAQFKVQELQAKKQLFAAAQNAVTSRNGLSAGQESHLDAFLQAFQNAQSRPSTPIDMVMLKASTPPPPGLDMVDGRASQSWHPTDIQRGAAWVI